MIPPKRFAFAVGLFFLVAVCQPLTAADRYVRGSTGVNAPGCTDSANPCQTIVYTLSQSACGDTIHIHGDGGTPYAENVVVANVCTAGNELTFRAWGGTGTPIIDNNGSDAFELQGAHLILDGLHHNDNFEGIWCNGASFVTIRNNIVTNNASHGFADPIASGLNCDNVTIEDSDFFNNVAEGIYYEGDVITVRRNIIHDNGPNDQGIHVDSLATGAVSITDNTVYNQEDDGIWVETANATGTCLVSRNVVYNTNTVDNFAAIDVVKPSCTIKNNLVYSNGFDGIWAHGNNQLVENNTVEGSVRDGIQTWATGIVVRNNILSNNGRYGLRSESGPDPTETFNLFYNNTSSDCNSITGCPDGTDITGSDPLFTSGYRLSQIAAGQPTDSPALDAGSDTAANIGLDTKTTRTDGVPDSGTVDIGYHFAAAGNCVVTTPIGSGEDRGRAVAIQSDGKMVAGGWSHNGADFDLAAVRYNTDGSLDSSFDTDGKVTTPIGSGNDVGWAVAIQSDGKIVVAGYSHNGSNDDFAVVRYNADGSLDSSFDTDGKVTTPIGSGNDLGVSMAIQSDGKIVVAGSSHNGSNWDIAVVRYNADGSLDSSFDTDGKVTTPIGSNNDRGRAVAIQSDGKIVVVGVSHNGSDNDFAAVRYNADGSLDTSFDTDGKVTTPIGSGNDRGATVAMQSDGKIVVAGESHNGTDNDFAAVRYNADGSLDTSFDTDGKVITPIGSGDDAGLAVAIQSDGKIVVAGESHNGADDDFAVVRYNTDGSLDTSFDTDGKVTTPIGSGRDEGRAVALQSDGSIVVAGFGWNGTDDDVAVVRYNPDGSLATGCGVVNYRSIGTAGNYTDGSGVTATNGSTVVTGIAAATWLTSNRGRGDLITIDTVPYTVLSVDSETQLTLTAPYTETTGSGKAYTIARKFGTLQAWENCIDATTVVLPSCHDVYTADFAADKRSEVGIAYKDSVFMEALLISGSTTDAVHNITLTVDPGNRHTGIEGTGVVLDGQDITNRHVIISDDNVVFEWFELTRQDDATGAVFEGFAGANVLLQNLIIHDFLNDGFDLDAGGGVSFTLRNSLIYNYAGFGIWGGSSPGSTGTIENCTFYGLGGTGIHDGGGGGSVFTVRNTISMGHSPDFNVANGTQDNNMSSDTSALPVGNQSKLPSDQFIDHLGATPDLHLKGTADALSIATDLSAIFSDDFEGGLRPAGGGWDIGADEESAAAGGFLSLANHPSGQVANKFSGATPITDTYFQFRLTPTGAVNVDTARVGFTTFTGVLNADVTNGELWEDTNGNGTWDDSGGGDTLLEGSVTPSGGVLTFNNNFPPGAGGTNYFIRATVANLVAGNSTVFSLDTAGIDEVETGVIESGSITNALHSQSMSPTVNYRSIGTNSAILYQAGTASISAGSNAVTFGGGASLPVPTAIGAVGQGDKLVIGSETFFILSRDSNTQVTIQEIAVSTHASEGYTITRAYNTLQDWEDDCVAVPGCLPTSAGGRGGDLVTDDRYEIGVAYNDGPFTTGATVNGSTTDATHYLHLTVAPGQRHAGIAGTGVVLDGVDTDQGIRLSDDYTVVEWFEFTRNRGSGSAAGLVVQNASNVLIQQVIIHDFLDPGNFVTGIRGESNADYTVRNCIIYDGGRAGIRNNDPSATGLVENCAIYGMVDGGSGAGLLRSAGTLTVTNTISMGNEVDFSGTITQSYNMSEDATANCGATCRPSENPTLQFVSITAGSEDLHLKVGANAIDAANPTPLSFCCDIDGGARIGTWDIGADEFGGGGASGCGPDLQVTEGSGTFTVTAPGSFEMRFNEATGGGIDLFYDLAEDPGRTIDLAGGTNEVKTLFHVNMFDGATFFTTSTNDSGAQVDVLEVTATRVKVRQNTFLQDQGGPTILGGVKAFGDYTVYPSGKMAIKWNMKSTTAVTYSSQGIELGVHYSSTGGNPLNNWTAHRELGTLFGPGNSFGDDDFVMMKNDSVGARTDFLQILYEDWASPTFEETADYSDSVQNGANEYAFVNWRATGAAGLPVDSDQTWNYLSFFKPNNFVDRLDAAVTGRRDDYRGPDDLATPVALAAGSGWFHPSENTVGPSDFFNESEGVYTLDFDMTNGLNFDIDGGLGAPPVRHAPFFKIRQWRSLQDPATVTLEGVTLANDADYRADVKPLSRVYAGQDPIWYSTLQETTAISPPDIGSVGIIMGTPTYVPARYGQGARFDGVSDVIRFDATGMDVTRGTVEFWVQPEFDHTDGVRHTFWFNSGSGGDFFLLEKDAANNLELGVFNGTSTFVRILSADYSWRDGDWVHIRAVWRDAASPGSQLQLYVNGSEPTHTDSGTYSATGMTVGNNYIGNIAAGTSPANAVIDEFVLYEGNHQPGLRAYAGLTSHPKEFMASPTNNFAFALWPADAQGRTDYFYFGSDNQFRGLNIALERAGVGTPLLKWEYWDGVNGAWADLDTLGTFVDETDSLRELHGTIYWEEDPPNWMPYAVTDGPELYYVRLHALAGSNYTTMPKEALIKTDILLFQLCGDITAAAQTFNFPIPLATAVELVSFDALPLDGAVALEWRTGSELDNLGFHLYRSETEEGPYTRITTSVIPGLGSSPQGAQYSYRDSGLTNDVTYYYQLEDIETSGKKELNGPVSATPTTEVVVEGDPEAAESSTGDDLGELSSRITYGDPSANELKVRRRGKKWMELTLITEGFYAIPQDDGSVFLDVPGFEDFGGPELPDVPAYRTWQDVLAGRNVTVASVKVSGVAEFASLRPSSSELIVVASGDGTVQTGRRRKRRRQPPHVYYPESWAQLMSVGFQGAAKKALVEMAPLRWDATAEKLVLARSLVVRIAFKGKDKAELKLGKSHREVGSHANRSVYARIAVTEPGLYEVSYESVFGQFGKRKKPIKTSHLRLSRQGEPVAFFVSPNAKKFKKKSKLYFLSDGSDLNPYGQEAVYELEASQQGIHMESLNGAPLGAPTSFYWKTVEREENLLYQAAFEGEEDIWQWDWLFGPMTNGYPFEVTNLSAIPENSKLRVWLHGASDFPEDPDHHVRLYINGILIDDTWWDGETPHFVEAELGPGLLLEGENTLEIEEVGDTEAQYSMVMLDRFEVSHPAQLVAEDGELSGSFSESGVATITSPPGKVFDTTEQQPKRVTGVVGTSFLAESGHRYLSTSSAKTPEVRPARAGGLKKAWSRAEYLVIGPREFLEAAEPLLFHRRDEGLISGAIATEDIYDEFGYGEATPESIKDFLSYVYHHWSEPTLRYVALLGDGTYDTKDYLATGVKSHVPVKIVETRYMWTASDPWYGAINGDDILPDIAIGRLPAASVEEVQSLVGKILAYESVEGDPEAPIVLITDNPDLAGNFDADAEEIASTLLAEESIEKVYLSQLGTAAAHGSIMNAFADGASVMSYLGHGAIHLWAQENLLNVWDIDSLAPQSQQPLLFTMNCLNGYFHFPYFNSLSEELLKTEGKGIIAAFSPTGLSLNSPAHRFHKALLQQVVHGDHERLGDAILAGQTGYAHTGAYPELLRIYHLLGDPALRRH